MVYVVLALFTSTANCMPTLILIFSGKSLQTYSSELEEVSSPSSDFAAATVVSEATLKAPSTEAMIFHRAFEVDLVHLLPLLLSSNNTPATDLTF